MGDVYPTTDIKQEDSVRSHHSSYRLFAQVSDMSQVAAVILDGQIAQPVEPKNTVRFLFSQWVQCPSTILCVCLQVAAASSAPEHQAIHSVLVVDQSVRVIFIMWVAGPQHPREALRSCTEAFGAT